ncbi:hypothetical protein MMC22_005853 [Lobaria immixta]|nr:hypothetical protein [Lobaria immixta]
MSFFGLGDVLPLTSLIIGTIKDIHRAPEELREVATRVASAEQTLRVVSISGSAGGPFNNDSFARTAQFKKQKIIETLSEMQKIVEKYKNASVFDRAKYLLSSKSALSNLDNKLSQQNQDLTTFLNGKLTSQLQPFVPLIPLLKKFLEKQDEETKREEKRWATAGARNPLGFSGHSTASESLPKRVHRVQPALNSVLKSKPSDNTISQQNDALLQKYMEIQMNRAGLSTADISAIKMIGQQREKLTHPEDIDATSGAGGKQRLNGPTGWIMVVDNYNGVRSIIAQAYLEFVRVRTVNMTGDWLFNPVESAGVQIATPFSSKHLPGPLQLGKETPHDATLRAIAGDGDFRASEKQDILTRIKGHRSRGIDEWHFRKYGYMLCFNKTAFDKLQVLAARWKEKHANDPLGATPARIILLSNLILQTSVEQLGQKDRQILVDTIKAGIRGFLTREFGWTTPQGRIVDGPFRTKQIVLPFREDHAA